MIDMGDMGEPRIKVIAMPKDTNPSGNIFGGWIMSQIDVAGALGAKDLPIDRVVTVAVNAIEFHEPIFVGDVVSCYARIIYVGNCSIKTAVKVTAERTQNGTRRCVHVTSATVTYVAIGEDNIKMKIECSKEQKIALGIE